MDLNDITEQIIGGAILKSTEHWDPGSWNRPMKNVFVEK
jgi:hypothetical protein